MQLFKTIVLIVSSNLSMINFLVDIIGVIRMTYNNMLVQVQIMNASFYINTL